VQFRASAIALLNPNANRNELTTQTHLEHANNSSRSKTCVLVNPPDDHQPEIRAASLLHKLKHRTAFSGKQQGAMPFKITSC
jgi:hypothetical protein